MTEVDKLLWKLMLKEGAVVTIKSYYGWRYDPDLSDGLNFEDINWDKTKPIIEDSRSQFVGTFVDYDEQIKYLYGVVTMKDGKKYEMALSLEERGFIEIVNQVVEWMGQ